MKKHLLLIAVSLSLTVAYGQTNVYHPFPDSNALWQRHCFHTVTGNSSTCQYNVTGEDTLIGAYIYKKIFRETDFVYAFRQDIAAKKVFAATLFSSPPWMDYLLYDFSLAVGDTFSARPLANCDSNSIVTSIDSLLIGSSYRKRINLVDGTNGVPVSIIEGIGSTAGPVEWSCFEVGCYLCKYEDDSTSFIYNNCSLVGINEETDRISKYSILSNPFSTQTTFQFEEHLINACLTVYNSVGKKVVQIKDINGQTITLNRDNLPSGLYFVRLTEENNPHNHRAITIEKLLITNK